MRTRSQTGFAALQTEGAILPADLLRRIAEGDASLGGLDSGSYHLPAGERLSEAVSRSWSRLQGSWAAFKSAKERLPETDAGTTLTRERWLLPLFHELGYGRLTPTKPITIGEKSYGISHGWQHTPLHLVSFRLDLDKRQQGAAGASRSSPHSLLQELLNRSEEHLWGIVSNGLRLRILRDNASLSRQAFVEFDLEAIFDGELYADFAVLWLLCHESRVEAEVPESCWLETWSKTAKEQGTRALDRLRTGVEDAIRHLGSGFLSHPANGKLRDRLRSGALGRQEFYRELLRHVYRLLFVFVAEDREILLASGTSTEARSRFDRFFSTRRLRRRALRERGGRHGDLFATLSLVIGWLGSDDGRPEIGLPPLGSALFSPAAVPATGACEVANRDLLAAVRAIAISSDGAVYRTVDYRNLGSEELGSVYESLLELHPDVDVATGLFELRTVAGHERKTTGSYYTPESLVKCLLDTALDPVIDAASRQSDPVAALLNLKVCDPACGSGHFLIAASHRLAHRVAFFRAGSAEPTPDQLRAALREVIGRCVYGVDLNPMAVELCKVALWMEALEPGKPLSFLDHHIRCGNSLLGVTPALLAAGVPDEAFDPLEGDDRTLSRDLKRQNRRERTSGQAAFLVVPERSDTVEDVRKALVSISVIEDSTLAGVRAREQRWLSTEASEAMRTARLAADAWCAAFVWELNAGRPLPLTSGQIGTLELSASGLAEPTHREIDRLAREYRFFHWHLAFPEVFHVPARGETAANEAAAWSGGFDAVLGNPPWERVKLQAEEFFASRSPEIASAKNAAARKKLIAGLSETNPALAVEWAHASRLAATESAFLRLSTRYPLGGVGDVNTYAVFADLFRQLVNPSGAAALLLPNGLVTGFTYRSFLRHLLETRTLASFYGFENEDRIFPEVHNETKFGILTMTGSARPVDRPLFTAHLRQPEQVHDPLRRYSLTAEQIEAMSPNTLTLPTFRWAADAEVMAAIHAAAPVLLRRSNDGAVENPWQLRFRRMFDMANDSGLFLDDADIARKIVERREALAILDDGRHVYPLYEGKMLWHFDHRYGTYAGQTEKQANKGVLPHVTEASHADPYFRVQPRYWIDAGVTVEALGSDAVGDWFFAFRDTGISERTFIGCVIPRTAAGHKAPLLVCGAEAAAAAALFGILSSLLVDYDARQRSVLMTQFVVEQLPMPTPHTLGQRPPWLAEPARDWLARRVLELSYTSVELAPFARSLGYQGAPFRWDSERRVRLQAEVDALVFHLFGLGRKEAEWILDSFTVLRKYEESEEGEFRTKRVVLKIYDAMASAAASGEQYQTRLDPPPADPRASHPAHAS